MLTILICWGLAAIAGWVVGKIMKQEREGAGGPVLEPEEAPGACAPDFDDYDGLMAAMVTPLAAVLGDASREYRNKLHGMDLMQLDACVRAALAGSLDRETAVYMLRKIGAWKYVEKLTGVES